MLSLNTTQTVDFLTHSAMLSSNFAQYSIQDINQHHCESLNRVVRIDEQSTTCPESPIKTVPAVKPKREKKEWSPEEKLQYFCGVIIFAFQNPYLRLTWQEQKPKRFFKFLEEHMKSKGCNRNYMQIKSKDQNFKKKYYLKDNMGIDMLPLSLNRVEAFVQRIEHAQSKMKPVSKSDLKRMKKFKDALSRYKEFIDATNKQSMYEQAIQKLVNFEISIQGEIEELWRKSILS